MNNRELIKSGRSCPGADLNDRPVIFAQAQRNRVEMPNRTAVPSPLVVTTRWPDAKIEISGDASAVDVVRRCFEHAAISEEGER